MHDVENLEAALRALGIDPGHAADGFRAANPFVVAASLAERGIRVMPSNKHKIPKIKSWQNDASNDPAQLVRWQARFQSPCWSVLTGRYPEGGGVWILDEDDLAGRTRREELECELGPLPQTWSVVSGREGGGRHFWFAPAPEGPDLKTVAHALIAGKRGRIDQRGRGGHAVLPGSRHKSGRRYAWALGCAPDECELASLPPSWLAALDMADAPTARSERRVSSGPRARIEHDGSKRLFGDGPGRGGFNGPIYYWACWFFGEYGVDADADALIAWLRSKIESAPRDPGRSDSDIARYSSEPYLREQAVRARDYLKQEETYGLQQDG